MSSTSPNTLLYELEQKIPAATALFCACQHLLASVVGIITPPLIIGSALGMNAYLPYLISMSLLASGIGTFLQAHRFKGIGAGMICLQGTSFAYVGVIISGGMWMKGQGASSEQILAMIFGVNFIAALIPILVSQFIEPLKKIFTPIVTGTVITLIGISLIKVSMLNWGGGVHAEHFGSPMQLILGAVTLGVIILLNRLDNQYIRLSAIMIGIIAGCLLAAWSGEFHFKPITVDHWITVPELFRFGFSFSWTLFVPIALVSVIALIEAVGDLTANCMISHQPIDNAAFRTRLKGGIFGDGLNCMIAAMLGSFPNTTFAQNNGVIQMTGVASRRVGRYIGVLLILLGLFPGLGAIVEQIPPAVLGGATLVMFGSVIAAGIRIITQSPLGRREMLIVALSFGLGLGIQAVPDILGQFPTIISNLFGSAVTAGGITAIVLSLFLPQEHTSSAPAVHSSVRVKN
ncbi:nucleobase:cation symporter-2 family protein [Celerinatantimonas sp. YJH-8]|uniref:nucleobase:cation symporter-2 family protein n=1 Tax=Celerinatantimonas sp. YJH-8 TaxID=3228714 RepID=UPI0038CACF52